MSKLNQTNIIFTISRELQIKLLIWQNATSHESILVKVKLAHDLWGMTCSLNVYVSMLWVTLDDLLVEYIGILQ